jgi:hypothetical protein
MADVLIPKRGRGGALGEGRSFGNRYQNKSLWVVLDFNG